MAIMLVSWGHFAMLQFWHGVAAETLHSRASVPAALGSSTTPETLRRLVKHFHVLGEFLVFCLISPTHLLDAESLKVVTTAWKHIFTLASYGGATVL